MTFSMPALKRSIFLALVLAFNGSLALAQAHLPGYDGEVSEITCYQGPDGVGKLQFHIYMGDGIHGTATLEKWAMPPSQNPRLLTEEAVVKYEGSESLPVMYAKTHDQGAAILVLDTATGGQNLYLRIQKNPNFVPYSEQHYYKASLHSSARSMSNPECQVF